MEASMSLRTAICGIGIALAVYVVANLLMAFRVLRPAPAVEAPAPTDNAAVSLLADQTDWQSLSGTWGLR